MKLSHDESTLQAQIEMIDYQIVQLQKRRQLLAEAQEKEQPRIDINTAILQTPQHDPLWA